MEEVSVSKKRVRDLEAEIDQRKQEIAKIKKTARTTLDAKLNELIKGLRLIDGFSKEGHCVGLSMSCVIRMPTQKGQKTFVGHIIKLNVSYTFHITLAENGNAVLINGETQKYDKLDELTKEVVDWCRQSDAIFDLYNKYLEEIE